MNRYITLFGIGAALTQACAMTPSAASDPEAVSAPPAAAPTYTELFDSYFAPGKPGHCATAGCHADPGHNVWLCSTTKDLCYQGMVGVGLIDPDNPAESEIVDARRSPLTWVNAAGGNMPLDAQGDNDAARAAIQAWIDAGAQND